MLALFFSAVLLFVNGFFVAAEFSLIAARKSQLDARAAEGDARAASAARSVGELSFMLSASQLGTKYLNEWFIVTREVRDRASGAIKVPADYSEVGVLLIAATAIGVAVPLATIAIVRALRLRTA